MVLYGYCRLSTILLFVKKHHPFTRFIKFIMKYTISLFTILLYANTVTAQLTKGNWLFNGNGDFYSYRDNYIIHDFNGSDLSISSKVTSITLSANIGYFVTDRLAFGLKPTVLFFKNKGSVDTVNSSPFSQSTQEYGLGPFGRYYFLDKKKEYNILVDAGYQFGIYFGNDNKIESSNTFSVAAGPVIYFNSSVGIEFLVGYRYNTRTSNKSTHKDFNIGIGFQIHLDKRERRR